MAYTSRVIFSPLLKRGAGTYTAEMNLNYAVELVLFLDITAVAGTTKFLNVKFEIADTLGGWYSHTVFTEKTTTGKDHKSMTIFGDRVKVTAVVTGTEIPEITFAITGVVKTTGRP